MSARASLLWLPGRLGAGVLSFVQAVGILFVVLGRTARALFRLNGRELARGLLNFGWDSLAVSLWVAMVIGALVITQSGLYVTRFGARAFVGWAAGFAVIWEFGPLILGLTLAARVGARNAAELSSLKTGGQLEGLRGISLDPFRLLVAPRVVSIVVSTGLLTLLTFLVAILFEIVAAYLTLRLPIRVFRDGLAEALGFRDVLGGLTKSLAFGLAISLVSTAVGLRTHGGARAVGTTAASAVVWGCLSIFTLDLLLTPLLAKVFAP